MPTRPPVGRTPTRRPLRTLVGVLAEAILRDGGGAGSGPPSSARTGPPRRSPPWPATAAAGAPAVVALRQRRPRPRLRRLAELDPLPGVPAVTHLSAGARRSAARRLRRARGCQGGRVRQRDRADRSAVGPGLSSDPSAAGRLTLEAPTATAGTVRGAGFGTAPAPPVGRAPGAGRRSDGAAPARTATQPVPGPAPGRRRRLGGREPLGTARSRSGRPEEEPAGPAGGLGRAGAGGLAGPAGGLRPAGAALARAVRPWPAEPWPPSAWRSAALAGRPWRGPAGLERPRTLGRSGLRRGGLGRRRLARWPSPAALAGAAALAGQPWPPSAGLWRAAFAGPALAGAAFAALGALGRRLAGPRLGRAALGRAPWPQPWRALRRAPWPPALAAAGRPRAASTRLRLVSRAARTSSASANSRRRTRLKRFSTSRSTRRTSATERSRCRRFKKRPSVVYGPPSAPPGRLPCSSGSNPWPGRHWSSPPGPPPPTLSTRGRARRGPWPASCCGRRGAPGCSPPSPPGPSG